MISLYLVALYPNVTLENVGTPAVTAPFNIYIYSWPPEEQARCPGNVSTIEYCFQRQSSIQIQPVFTLLLLKSLSNGYRISDIINVSSRNFRSCSNRGGIATCCERKLLRRANQFHIPSAEIDSFGIFATGDNRILGYQPEQQNTTRGFQIPVDAFRNGYIGLKRIGMTIITYRMFNFVVGEIM